MWTFKQQLTPKTFQIWLQKLQTTKCLRVDFNLIRTVTYFIYEPVKFPSVCALVT